MGDEQTEGDGQTKNELTQGGLPQDELTQDDDPRMPGDLADRYREKPRRLADVIEDFVQTLDYKKQETTIDRILTTRDLGDYDRAAMIAVAALADNHCVPELGDLRAVLDIARRHPGMYPEGEKAATSLVDPSKKRFGYWYTKPWWRRRELVRFDNPTPRSEQYMAVDRIAGLLRKAGREESAEELLQLAYTPGEDLGLTSFADELLEQQIPLSVADAASVLAAQLNDDYPQVESSLRLVLMAVRRAGVTQVPLAWEPDPQDLPMPVIYEPHLDDLIRRREPQLSKAGDTDAVLVMNVLANSGEPLPAYLLGFYRSVQDHLPISFREIGDVRDYIDYLVVKDDDISDAVTQVLAPARAVAKKLISAARQAMGKETGANGKTRSAVASHDAATCDSDVSCDADNSHSDNSRSDNPGSGSSSDPGNIDSDNHDAGSFDSDNHDCGDSDSDSFNSGSDSLGSAMAIGDYAEVVNQCVDILHDHPVPLHLTEEEIETGVRLVQSVSWTEDEATKTRAVLEVAERRYQGEGLK